MATAKSGYTDAEKAEIVEEVLNGMAEGQTVQDTVKVRQKAFWKAGKDSPLTPGMVRQWMRAREDWWSRYQRMKPVLGQALAEEAIRVARDSTGTTTAVDRVLIETLKWAAAKANPVEFGEKQTVEHQGAQTLQVKIVEEAPEVRNPEALERGLERQIGNAIATAITTPVMLTLPAPMKSVDPSEDED